MNRLKVNMYVKMGQLKLSAEEYLQHMVKIKSQLFLGFSHMMEGLYQKRWPSVLKGFTRCEIIAGELRLLAEPSASSPMDVSSYEQSWSFWYLLAEAHPEDRRQLTREDSPPCFRSMSDKYGLRQKLLQLLDQQVQELSETIDQFRSEGLAAELINELKQLGDKFQRLVNTANVPENMMR